ncbi:hypothetical protein AAXB25_19265 [Paenibacillus lautus]|uniref:MurR/RpiR family transcriptional regulator n=1 Tax=Paenibacillus lautus TaxID=1401 RepID=UPI003D2D0437
MSIEGAYDSLSAMERRVAKYILENPQEVMGISVQRLAQTVKVSEATIIRLSRSLKCEGFKELKMRIGQIWSCQRIQRMNTGSSKLVNPPPS